MGILPSDTSLSPEAIRALRAADAKTRARDFAAKHGIAEAVLVAAHTGFGVTRIQPKLDLFMPFVARMGDVMALTRNESCVHERRGSYANYHGGAHAQMVLGSEIDLRMFPAHWCHAFAVTDQGEAGPKHSIQVFDAAGDAVHKIHLGPESQVAEFERMREALALPDQSAALALTPRAPVEGAFGDPRDVDALRTSWNAMTDTHQFHQMVRKLKMNRLGAYRILGAPQAHRIERDAVTQVLQAAAADAIPLMIFVGNAGCIQIHGGLIEKVVPMGPWINVMDPRFNLHLRADHIAEVWCVTKPTDTGPAISVEAFDERGYLILQIFGYRKDALPVAWNALTVSLVRDAEAMA